MSEKNNLIVKLRSLYEKLDRLFVESKFDPTNNEHNKLWKQMVLTAHDLDKIVKPKHSKYLLKNRRVPQTDLKFYEHLDSIQSLIRFIENPHANDDPEDKTIGADFELKIYSRRWKHEDVYQVKRTENGWYISHMSISGECDKSGKPYLYRNFYQDFINYPEALPDFMRDLWLQAEEQGLTFDEVQEKLNKIGNWISICEKETPTDILR